MPDADERLRWVMNTMRELSRQTDPQAMVRVYGERVGKILPADRRVSLSRRGMKDGRYRITRCSDWKEEINPWKNPEALPVFQGGVLARLVYGNEPCIVADLRVEPDEPAIEYLGGYRSLMAVPLFDDGDSLNMVVLLAKNPNMFRRSELADAVWRSNLFGRATSNLVLKEELAKAYASLDREFRAVGEMQRSLLPATLPEIPGLDLAAYYQPAARAGGDYYDFFRLADGRWGIFIADVSGHGTPAAVVMAVTHCIAHLHPDPAAPPSDVLRYLNRHLLRYGVQTGRFVTAFYAVYDPRTRTLEYAAAGHNPPRLKRCSDGSLAILDRVGGLPLGVAEDAEFSDARYELQSGDQMVFYTDGITEAQNDAGELFGAARLDAELANCALRAKALLDSTLAAVEVFAAGRPPDDDRTLIIACVR
jgi:sigma-B regulation protein RsbU (phosphoserine phosphatase)